MTNLSKLTTLIRSTTLSVITMCTVALHSASAEDTVLKVAVPQAFGYFAAMMQKNIQIPGVKVEYKYFVNYSDMTDAILSGAVDIEDLGELAPIQMATNGSKIKAVACTGSNGKNTNLIVRPDVKANSFADLKSKRIAYTQTNNHKIFVVHLLKDYGLTEADITSVDIYGAEAISAFVNGQVDATSQNSPAAAAILEKVPGSYVIARGDEHDLTNLYCTVATAKAISTKADAIRGFIKAYEQTIKWAKANPDEYSKLVAAKLGVSENAARTALNNNSGGLATFDDDFLKAKQAYADEIHATGIIRKRADVKDIFIKTFNDAIAEPVKSVVQQ
jgi:sulfonate transport system substrate-binding protein